MNGSRENKQPLTQALCIVPVVCSRNTAQEDKQSHYAADRVPSVSCLCTFNFFVHALISQLVNYSFDEDDSDVRLTPFFLCL